MAERKLVTIQKIEEVQPIEGADKIEKVRVQGWWVVSNKGEFKEGDLCVFYEIDSLLPDIEMYAFLKRGSTLKRMLVDGEVKVGIRLKSIKLKGQISQGLVLPISHFFKNENGHIDDSFSMNVVGTDVTEELGVIKFEPPLPAELAGKVKGFFPGFIPKTDEERVQNLGDMIQRHQGILLYVTEKLDGASATYYKKDGIFGVCSRNLELLETEGNTIWAVARLLRLEERMPDGYAIQGELIGEGIQSNPLKIKGQEFYAFNVYEISIGKYLDFSDLHNFLRIKGIKMVPIISDIFRLMHTVEELIRMADNPSLINPLALREGIVFRPLTEMRTMMNGVEGRLSFKSISNDYLLTHEQ